jgi:hypothetical protein
MRDECIRSGYVSLRLDMLKFTDAHAHTIVFSGVIMKPTSRI